MMYIMPIMFLFIFNSYSSGLSYYYFIATLITILQTWIIRKFVDDKKLLKQLELAKTKPVKKSKFRHPFNRNLLPENCLRKLLTANNSQKVR